jgi:hypothetical protein
MLHYRKFPDDLFVGGGAAREQLRTLIEAPREEP